jgi:Uma2 family endonuclease
MTEAFKIEDRYYTVEEYFDLMEKTGLKFEYNEGRVFDLRMMAGTSVAHALIAMNFGAALHSRMSGSPCRVFGSDLLVRIARKAKYRFPDLAVICGPEEIDRSSPSHREAVTNPVLLVEVLSDSTAKDDRGEKFAEYRELDSLREYVLVSQHRPLIEVFRRHDDGTWGIFTIVEGLDADLELKSIDACVPLRDIYARVAFSAKNAADVPPPETR